MFDRCEALAEKWDQYIKPLAEAWWAERGYRLPWPSATPNLVRWMCWTGLHRTSGNLHGLDF
jgi:hypothetical protein